MYHQNAARYLTQLAHLDGCITAAMHTLEPHQRKLLTYHDSWPYFARRYGLTIIGAVQPANFSEPSPREVARLIDQLRREKVLQSSARKCSRAKSCTRLPLKPVCAM